jgi:hypothetical protein
MKFLLFILIITLSYSQTFGQCAISPTSSINYVSTSGANCTYSVSLSLTSNTNALKFISFIINGTKVCLRSNGTAFVADNTCGAGPNGVNIGNAPVVARLINYVFTIPCSTVPAISYEASQSATNTAQCITPVVINLTFPFPVKLSSFDANAETDKIILNWKATDEVSFDKYIIQRSTDAKSFESIGEVLSDKSKEYFFEDKNPKSAINYYRLKLQDLDGTIKYSKIISAIFNSDKQLLLYPNPVTENRFFIDEIVHKKDITLLTMNGIIVPFELQSHENKTIIIPNQGPNIKTLIMALDNGSKIENQRIIIK